MKVPVIINNRDLLTWPKEMVNRIKDYEDLDDIIIIDNGSTYEPLLEWYKTKPCTILSYIENFGHTGPWDSGVVQRIGAPYYIVTDSDLGLESVPNNVIPYLLEKEKSLKLGKVGLGLQWWKVTKQSPYHTHMQIYEIPRWDDSKINEDVAVNVAIDTTFALYSRDEYFIGGGSTKMPYMARHIPWELTNDDYEANEEFKYYIKHASNSSSYKWFLKK